MNSYQYQFSEVLSILLEANKIDLISDEEKIQIKQLILSQNKSIEEILNEYKENKNKLNLINKLVNFVKNTKMSPSLDHLKHPKNSPNSTDISMMDINILSSPIGQALVEKKRKNYRSRTFIETLEKIERDNFYLNCFAERPRVIQCDFGISPKITSKIKEVFEL